MREMRAFVFRKLTRVMAPAGNIAGLEAMANTMPEDRGDVLAVVGMELLTMGRRDEAERIAKQASLGSPTNSATLIALWLALGAADAGPEKVKLAVEKARAVAPPPGGEVTLNAVNRAGYAEGWARQGRIDDGRKLAEQPGNAEDRLRALAGVAAAVVQTKKDTADLEKCAKLLETEIKARPDQKWLVLRLVQLSLQAGNRELAGRFVNVIADEGLKAWARYEIFRDKLAAGDATVDEALAVIGDKPPDKFDPPARWLAVVALMQHKAAAAGKGAASGEVAAMSPGPAQAFGYAGVALSEK
jgi:hypothetical protein